MTYEIELSPEALPALREALLWEQIDELSLIWGEHADELPAAPRSAAVHSP